MDQEGRKKKVSSLASSQINQDESPRFITSGRSIRFQNNVEYEPVLMRKHDRKHLLELLIISGEVSEDVALLFEVVTAQTRLIAEQSLEINRMRHEVDMLRNERVAANVTQQVANAVFESAEKGIPIEGLELTIKTMDTSLDTMRTSTDDDSEAHRKAQGGWAASAGLGAVLNALQGAHLKASDIETAIEAAKSSLSKITEKRTLGERRFDGTLKIAKVGSPPK